MLKNVKKFNSNITVDEGKRIQQELSRQVIRKDQFNTPLSYVAGVDVGFSKDDLRSFASAAVLNYKDLKVVETAVAAEPTTFPYVSGMFSFREIPPLLKALGKIKTKPDMILCDGQGLAHPRRFGMACHLGVLLDLPTIGVAKSRLIGTHVQLGEKRGSWEKLIDKTEVVGAVLRTQDGVNPVYVSVGHKVSLASAIRIVLDCTPKYRLPETTRQADRLTRTNL